MSGTARGWYGAIILLLSSAAACSDDTAPIDEGMDASTDAATVTGLCGAGCSGATAQCDALTGECVECLFD